MNSKNYVAGNSIQLKDAQVVMDQYLEKMYWDGDHHVLDVGCGTGEVTLQMLLPRVKNCQSLLGIDKSSDMISFAEANNSDCRVSFKTMNISTNEDPKLILKRSSFEKIFSFHCLHWVQDQKRAFQNMYDLLSPGGQILVLIIGSHPIFYAYEQLKNDKRWLPYMKDVDEMTSPYHKSLQPAHDLRSTIEKVGFTVLECKCNNKTSFYPSTQHLKDMIQGVNPFVTRMPSIMQSAYIEHMTETVTALGQKNEDKSISIKFTNLVALASKPT